MSKKLQFVWIDDNPQIRGPESINIAKRLKADVDYKDVKNNDTQKCIEELIKRSTQPDLILIDHKLESKLFKTGSSVAALIRDRWPSCPIVCVTGVDIDTLSTINKSLYDEVIPFDYISDYDEKILSIANGFKKISETRYMNLNKLFDLLQVPESEIEKLKLILPDELKDDYTDFGIVTNLSDWVRRILMSRPGFLYDKLWTATLLGIKEASFKKVEALFKSAKYKGIFALDSDPRWWKASVLQILADNTKVRGLSFEKGRTLSYGKNKITKKDFSQSYVNQDETPETVAFIDDTSPDRYPESLKNTIPHPFYTDLLFFDQIRKIKPQE